LKKYIPPTLIDMNALLHAKTDWVIIDVRSPAEFAKAHIPEAVNLPLFSNEERAIVGTTYKQESPEQALLIGLEFAGLKMRQYIEQALLIAPEKKVLVYCWRGGKRSESMGWLLSMAGFEVHILKGGYKYYRRYALHYYAMNQPKLIVLGGQTGIGKTYVLHQLLHKGEQIIVTGTITMNLIEILDQSSMILMGMPTTSNGEILVSGGQINLTAMQGSTPVYLTNGSVSVMVPTSNFDSQMALFEGIENSEGDVDWILSIDDSTSMPDSLGFVPDSSGGFFGGYYYFDWSDSTMGWINCDYFYADPNPLTSLTADMSSDYNSSNTAAYLHFSSINSVASLYHSGGDFSASGIPEGMAVTVVCISEISGNYYSAFVPVTVTTNIIVPITMTATTLADFEAAVANL
jgi:rhodanese-related sulfurtransferase